MNLLRALLYQQKIGVKQTIISIIILDRQLRLRVYRMYEKNKLEKTKIFLRSPRNRLNKGVVPTNVCLRRCERDVLVFDRIGDRQQIEDVQPHQEDH